MSPQRTDSNDESTASKPFALIPQDKDHGIHTVAAGLDPLDFGIVLCTPMIVFIAATDVFGYSMSIPLIGVSLASGGVLFLLARYAPYYLSPRELVRRNLSYVWRRIRMPLVGKEARNVPGIVGVHRKFDALEHEDGSVFGVIEVTPINASQFSQADWFDWAGDVATALDTEISKFEDDGFDIKIRWEQSEYSPHELTALREAQTDGSFTGYVRQWAKRVENYFTREPADEDDDGGYLLREGVMDRSMQIIVPVGNDEGVEVNTLESTIREYGLMELTDAQRVGQGRLLDMRLNRVEAFANSVAAGRRLDTDEIIGLQRAHWQNERELDPADVTSDGPVLPPQETRFDGADDPTTAESTQTAVADGGTAAEELAESAGERPEDSDEDESDGTLARAYENLKYSLASHADETTRNRMYNIYAPQEVDEQKKHVNLNDGEQYARSLYLVGWPKDPKVGLLDPVIKNPSLRYAMTLNLHTTERYDKREELKAEKEKIAGSAIWSEWFGDGESSDADAAGIDKTELRDHMRDTRVDASETTLVVTVWGKTPKQVNAAAKEMKQECRQHGIQLKGARKNQLPALQTTAPSARDVLDEKMAVDLRYDLPAGAVGTVLSFGGGVRQDEDGTHIGYAKAGPGDSPILGAVQVDLDSLTTQHVGLMGRSGSGKTAGEEMRILDNNLRNDKKTVIIDIAEGFDGSTFAQDGAKIVVGDTIINPFEVNPPEDATGNVKPVEDKAEVITDMLMIHLRKHAPGDVAGLRQPAKDAVMTTFKRHGIIPGKIETLEPANRETDGYPTFSDFFDSVEYMKNNGEEFVRQSVAEEREGAAKKLLQHLSAFDTSQGEADYAFLDGQSEVDLTDDTVLLDMNHYEEKGTVERSMLMRLVTGQAYEIAKRTPRDVRVVVDEAHKVFHDEQDAEDFEELVRAGRNYGLSFDFISQATRDFAEGPAGIIADQCSLMIWHEVGDIDAQTLIDEFQMKPERASLITGGLDTGDNDGTDRSEALVFIEGDDEVYLVEQKLSDYEKALVEYKESSEGDFRAYMARKTDAHELPEDDIAVIDGLGDDPEAVSQLYAADIMTTVDLTNAGAEAVAEAADVTPEHALSWIQRAYQGDYLRYADEDEHEPSASEPVTPAQPEAATDGGCVLTDIAHVGEDMAATLHEAGYESVVDVQNADRNALTDVEGIGECRAEQVIESASGVLAGNQQDAHAVADGGTASSTDADDRGGE
ncbi:helix-hairpin-helix domain-containing protein [Halococcus sp. AFM35]|uniref:helix-hairpin-helix domain-containing protein n=1 Tax=Halococcus sp. AFM35 TaxID=3421653 RepID=UPI003EB9DE98